MTPNHLYLSICLSILSWPAACPCSCCRPTGLGLGLGFRLARVAAAAPQAARVVLAAAAEHTLPQPVEDG
eukprot:scaffold7725_cov45-Phaeocystis_antarctica.AAC.1